MKKIVKLILPLLCMSTMVGCGPVDAPLIDIVDIKTAFMAMQQKDNFEVKVKNSNDKEVYFGQYHKDYFYESVNNSGYLAKNDNVYPFYLEGSKIVNKLAKDVTSLYGTNGALIGPDDIDLSIVPDQANTFSTMKRAFASPLLEICGYSDSMYASLNSTKIDLKDKGLEVSFEFSKVVSGEGLQKYTEVATIGNIGNVSLPLIETFIKEGELTQIDADLLRIKSLFELDNYTQYQSDGTGISQVDIFDKEYFITLYTDYAVKKSPVLQMSQVGYLTILKPNETLDLLKDENGQPVPLIYDDTFYFQYFGTYEKTGDVNIITRNDPKRPGYASGAFKQIVKDVPSAFHYPKGLKLFSNLDDMKRVEGFNAYATTNKKLIDNLLADYALTDAFDQYGGIQEVQFIYEFNESDADCEVILRLVAPAGVYDIAYNKFGATEFAPFEEILTSIK